MMGTYGDFLRLARMNHTVDTFRLWLLMHTLPPIMQSRVLEKLQSERVMSC
jgi:hypothetical protein